MRGEDLLTEWVWYETLGNGGDHDKLEGTYPVFDVPVIVLKNTTLSIFWPRGYRFFISGPTF